MDNPWKTAEDEVFRVLCAATGSTAKQNAFQGYLPPKPNTWALKVGGGGDVRNTWSENITELRMNAEIEGVFLEREDAQKFALKILKALPIKRVANVQVFRLREGGMPDIPFDEVIMANQQARMVWLPVLKCDIVFNTIERANVEPSA